MLRGWIAPRPPSRIYKRVEITDHVINEVHCLARVESTKELKWNPGDRINVFPLPNVESTKELKFIANTAFLWVGQTHVESTKELKSN